MNKILIQLTHKDVAVRYFDAEHKVNVVVV